VPDTERSSGIPTRRTPGPSDPGPRRAPRLAAWATRTCAVLLLTGLSVAGNVPALRAAGPLGAEGSDGWSAGLPVAGALAGWPVLPLGDRPPADTTDVAGHIAPLTLTLHVDGEPLRVGYYANRPFGVVDSTVTRLIVVLHGTLRNADEYQASVVEAAELAAAAGDSAFIVTPQFLTEEDVAHWHLDEDYAYWAYMGWRKGDHSLNTIHHPRPFRISSFAVLDTVIYRLAASLPNLRRVVLAGHSAGGQFSNLYTATTAIHHWLAEERQIPVRSIVGNPSCYLYFSPERWVQGSNWEFAVPSPEEIEDCPGYNDFKYGLDNLNEYASAGADTLRARYAAREVVYLLGENDTNPYDYYLDVGCAAMLQGVHRRQRGTAYWHFLAHHFGPEIHDRQHLAIIPNVGHDHEGIFTSDCGLHYIFDAGGCTPPPEAEWTDATPACLLAVTSRAAAWGDYDGDDWPDLFAPATDQRDLLARNVEGVFVDASKEPLTDDGRGFSARWGDYDNDGRPDVYVVNYGDDSRLYHNEGGGLFTDVTAGPLAFTGNCVDAAWGDYDGDGDLDLYVTRTSNQGCGLLRNDGAGGFVNATAAPLDLSGNSRCPAWGDYDGDGDLDLFVARDGTDRLFRNDGAGSFVDVTDGPLGDQGEGVSAAWADYDNDGDLDLYIVNRNSPNRLLQNDGGSFSQIQGVTSDDGYGHSASWADYDNDGWLDLYLCNEQQANRLFRNIAGDFEEATVAPLDLDDTSFCGVWADYDGDGDLDLYVTTNGGENHLFRNDRPLGAGWMQVKLVGVVSNWSAIGAKVRLRSGGAWQLRQVGAGSGYSGESWSVASFGLGDAGAADSIVVEWPSGLVQRLGGGFAGYRLTITEGEAPSGIPPATAAGWALCVAPNPFRESARIRLLSPSQAMGSGRNGPAQPFRVEIFDPAGRLLRRLSGPAAAAASGLLWDGRDERGHAVAAGVYLVRSAPPFGAAARVLRTR